MIEYLGTIVDVKIDRPIGSRHPEYNFFYPVGTPTEIRIRRLKE